MDSKAVHAMLRGVISLALVGAGTLDATFAQQDVKQKESVLAQGPYQQSGAVLMVHFPDRSGEEIDSCLR